MTTYALGDIQGCYDKLLRLLDRLRFDPARDRLWFVGDLVSRGPDSLATLRFIKGLGERALTVLGNHDLSLLALAAGNPKRAGESSLEPVLRAADRDELLHWLRGRPLMHFDERKGFALIHAGLPPQWDLPTALSRAREVETRLRGPDYADYFRTMYGNEPARWSDALTGMDRLRFITNCFTRLRYCRADGTLVLKEKGPPGSQMPGALPWFALPDRATRELRILFGHWSTLGYAAGHNTWALDTGCVWQGRLTAIPVRRQGPGEPISIPCA
ncbi:MAG: symmetrical bis(5'-nucleosyl)-tetraphosphatase [Candidatus Thiosymbion ectosymbiont of Robbea hypermnestra]|nr:symmetrical bis(5'-nucleosyl)-tetraphosphatase [Candidatus Thiosymbion ectosymbiont of Robbea hypermnestra]